MPVTAGLFAHKERCCRLGHRPTWFRSIPDLAGPVGAAAACSSFLWKPAARCEPACLLYIRQPAVRIYRLWPAGCHRVWVSQPDIYSCGIRSRQPDPCSTGIWIPAGCYWVWEWSAFQRHVCIRCITGVGGVWRNPAADYRNTCRCLRSLYLPPPPPPGRRGPLCKECLMGTSITSS